METLVKVIGFIASFIIMSLIVATPLALLENRLKRIKLIGIYALMALIFYILSLVEVRFKIVDWTANSPSFFIGVITVFSFIMSVCVALYLVFRSFLSKINLKINFKKAVIGIVLVIFVVGFILPLIPGILFAFGIKTEDWPVKALYVEPKTLQIKSVTLDGLKGCLYLQVQNDNIFPATITRIDFNVYSPDGTLIAKGKIPKSIIIPAKKWKLIYLNFKVPWTGASKFAYDTLVSILKEENSHLIVKGYVYLDFFRILTIPIPFSKEVVVWS